MAELAPKAMQELVVTAQQRPAREYAHTVAWAQDRLRQAIPQASTTLTGDGVLVARVPTTTDLQTVQAVVGENFSVGPNVRLQY